MSTLTQPRAVRIGAISARVRPIGPIVVGAALIVLFVLFALSLTLGDVSVSVGQVLATIRGDGNKLENLVVLDLRMPRAITAIFVGIALGASGAVSQTMTRNPLASPDILGITSGASLGAVAVIAWFGASIPAAWTGAAIPLSALGGGLITALIVYSLAWKRGVSDNRVIIVGIGVGAMAAALINWILILVREQDIQRAQIWLSGSLNGRSWTHVAVLAVVVPLLLFAVLAASRSLRALDFGDETAISLGVRVNGARITLAVLLVLLASFAVAAAGPIVFLALIAPQIALRLVGAATPPLVLSALVGAGVLLASDLVARLVFPQELPVGIITGAVGAVFLMYLLASTRRRVVS